MLLKCTYLNVYWCAMMFRDVSWCLHFTSRSNIGFPTTNFGEITRQNCEKRWKDLNSSQQQHERMHLLTYVFYMSCHIWNARSCVSIASPAFPPWLWYQDARSFSWSVISPFSSVSIALEASYLNSRCCVTPLQKFDPLWPNQAIFPHLSSPAAASELTSPVNNRSSIHTVIVLSRTKIQVSKSQVKSRFTGSQLGSRSPDAWYQFAVSIANDREVMNFQTIWCHI